MSVCDDGSICTMLQQVAAVLGRFYLWMVKGVIEGAAPPLFASYKFVPLWAIVIKVGLLPVIPTHQINTA